MAVVLVAGCDSGNDRALQYRAMERSVTSGPWIDTSVREIASSYRDNSIAADARYKGKVLRVVGIVDKVMRTKQGEPLIILGDGEGRAIGCLSPDEIPGATYLTPGSQHTLEGIGAGAVEDQPMLIMCRVGI